MPTSSSDDNVVNEQGRTVRLFVLRAITPITYNDPDEGMQDLGSSYEDLMFSFERAILAPHAEKLNRWYENEPWCAKRSAELRKLHPDRSIVPDGTKYEVVDVSHLINW